MSDVTRQGNFHSDSRRVVIVTGMSGAGKRSALNAFEDSGYTATDNLPMNAVVHVLEVTAPQSHAIGIDVRTHGFSVEKLFELHHRLSCEQGYAVDLLYLDCEDHKLIKRFSETRRAHPCAGKSMEELLTEERKLLSPLQELASHTIDTTDLSALDLSLLIHRQFVVDEHGPTFEFMSFGFKHGTPRNLTMMFDLRSMRNPHWDPELRNKTGQDADVVSHILEDRTSRIFLDTIRNAVDAYMDAVTREGRPFVTIAFGCTGGQHRSVAATEILARHAEEQGRQVIVTHRDLARRGLARPFKSALEQAPEVK